ncbi:transglycosylase family protein [uncultured Propionibacterium sp.]|uniref:transglycosylase family protein n=1 Tax=uncultured Propionibacterium sp. TaxID=218066 RepID=UPI00292EFD78|nr:transglycosylase family protein [uncultured Propionibacterium sp.]
MKKTWTAPVATCVGAATLFTSGFSIALANNDVELTVDGQTTEAHQLGGTVADLLNAHNITLGDHDVVSPAPETRITDGQRVSVNFGRQVNATIDGAGNSLWTTSTSLDDVLDSLGVADDARVSIDRNTRIEREGITITVVTPKHVTLVADGQERTMVSTDETVADLLASNGISLGERDRVSADANTPLTEGMRIQVQRVTVQNVKTTETIAHGTKRTEDDTLDSGTEKVTKQGRDGSKDVEYEVVMVDGVEESRSTRSEKVTSEPVTEEVAVGTKSGSGGGSSTGSTDGLDLSNADMWDRIAACESTGNWSINTGNGYYGGLQFDNQTWLGAGGGQYASRADLATREQQITIANRIYAQRGLSPWGCASAA